LLSVDRGQHQNITILLCIPSTDASLLTLFLKDTTYVPNTQDEYFAAGFMAVCERLPGEVFYAATVYHEWFMVNNQN